jgi:hypothetical protein
VSLPVSLDVKILVWEFDLEMLFEHSPGVPWWTASPTRWSASGVSGAEEERDVLMLSRRAPFGDQPKPAAQRQQRPKAQRTSRRRRRRRRRAATVPKSTSVISTIAPVIARAREAEPGDREPVGDVDQLLLLLQVEGQPVVGGGRDQQGGGEGGAEQRREVDLFLEGG